MGKLRKQERDGLSAEEVARVLRISQQRVYQLETSGLRKLCRGLAARGYGAEIADMPA